MAPPATATGLAPRHPDREPGAAGPASPLQPYDAPLRWWHRWAAPTTGWGLVRRAGLVVYGAVYLWVTLVYGVIVDRISVTLSLAVLLVVVTLGRPWRAWARMAGDLTLYAGMWFAYDETRGAADQLNLPLQVNSVRNIDRFLFAGTDPNVWMQAHFYHPEVVRWYDVVGSGVYFSHFVVVVAVIAVLWATNRPEWVRFMRRVATVLGLACVGYVLLPTAPPWMAGGGDPSVPLHSLPPLARPTVRGWSHAGLHSFVYAWQTGQDWVNRQAAMPSLHGAFALLVVLWLWPHGRHPLARAALALYPLAMLASLVYFGEHYVTDVLAGWACVLASFAFWARWERRRAAAVPPLDLRSVPPDADIPPHRPPVASRAE